jgi:hypothetical protein
MKPDPSTILVGRAYYGIGIESPGGPPVFNSISSFCPVCSFFAADQCEKPY